MRGSDRVGGPLLLRLARSRVPWFALLWLPILLLVPVVRGISEADLLDGVLLVLFCGVYLTGTGLPRSSAPRSSSEFAVAVLTVITIGYNIANPEQQGFVYPLLAIAMAVGIRRHAALSFVVALSISGGVAAGVSAGSPGDGLLFGFTAFVAGSGAYYIEFLTEALRQLFAARYELATRAVSQERDRLGRELHDVLGHTLSTMVVQAEAARRLALDHPTQAAEHARHVEDLGRAAMSRAREVVTGGGRVSLRGVIDDARDPLTAAGVRLQTMELPRLPERVDTLFGAIAREGITNVLRHSRAASCTITVARDQQEATIEVIDDGWAPGQASPARSGANPANSGQGLIGLRQRVADVDGILVAESTGRGFRLSATVPTGQAP